jgi:succinate dehydrogenase / fumarate reductase membrane anchor subunit
MQALKPQIMRSQLGRVRGLGAARAGTAHWWLQRLTAIALVPLALWFIVAALHLSGLPRADVAHWAANPVNTALLISLVVAAFQHGQLGLQVVLEDYIHGEALRLVLVLLVKGAAFLLGLIAVLAVLKLAVSG